MSNRWVAARLSLALMLPLLLGPLTGALGAPPSGAAQMRPAPQGPVSPPETAEAAAFDVSPPLRELAALAFEGELRGEVEEEDEEAEALGEPGPAERERAREAREERERAGDMTAERERAERAAEAGEQAEPAAEAREERERAERARDDREGGGGPVADRGEGPRPDTILPPVREPLAVDPDLQTAVGPPNALTVVRSFEGIDTAHSFPIGSNWPGDLSGAVGPNHYVQTVNWAYAVYDKNGNVLLPPARTWTFWAGFSGAGGSCGVGWNWSDVVVLYDRLADRWFVSRFAQDQNNTNFWYQCFAISQTPDPTGAYYRYAFLISQTEFNDYPKFGIWPDAYYMTANRNKIFSATGIFVVAFERAKMLIGSPAAQMVMFTLNNNGFRAGMLPADWDGATQPPTGAPNYLVRPLDVNLGWPSNGLEVWQFHVDWTNTANSTLLLATTVSPGVFNSRLCNLSQNCIPQPGTSTGLDPLAYGYLMYRLVYRNFGGYETLLLNQTVDVGDFANHAGIRWYELRKIGLLPWLIYQQSTYAPDANHRWVGSLAMDRDGNLALGYSTSSSSVFPSIRYAGRQAGDPLNTLSQEATFMAGGGSQTGFVFWDDWTQMTVDPTDDCTFWYVNGYNPTTSANQNWNTRIGALSFPSCGRGTPTPTPTATATSTRLPTTPTATITPGGPTPTPTATPRPSCAPRPPVGVTVGPTTQHRLLATITANTGPGAPTNALVSLQFGAATNALIDVTGGPTNQTGNFTYTPPPGTQQVTFTIQQVTGGGAATVPLVVTDACGTWPTFVGGGPSAFS